MKEAEYGQPLFEYTQNELETRIKDCVDLLCNLEGVTLSIDNLQKYARELNGLLRIKYSDKPELYESNQVQIIAHGADYHIMMGKVVDTNPKPEGDI